MNQTVQKQKRAAQPKAVAPRTNDPERTMADIIEVATHEFSEKGLAGARIDVIAEAMRTSKRMIYYYFGSKEGLYIRVLEEALEQKAIDGQENPLSVIVANKFAEVQKYLALTNHQYNPQSIIFSKKVWDTLSPAEQKILQDAALEAAKYQRQVNRDAAAGQLDALKEAGMQVSEFSPAEQAKLRK